MRGAFRAIVIAGFCLGLLLGFFAFDVARAQTATPTPTATNTPIPTPTVFAPTATPTPATTPVYTGGEDSTVVWACIGFQANGGVACTWGDYFEFNLQTQNSGVDGSPVVTQDPPGGEFARYGFVPPANTRAITVTCSYLSNGGVWDFGLGDVRIDSFYGPGRGDGTLDLYVDGVLANTPEIINVYYAAQQPTDQNASETLETYQYTWVLRQQYSVWPGSDLPLGYNDLSGYARFGARVQVGASGHDENFGIMVLRAACEVNQVTRLDGSTYVPTNPVVGDGGTPTPEPGWADYDWLTPVPYLIAPPQNSFFDFGESSSQCFNVLPGFDSASDGGWAGNILGYTGVSFGWSARALCLDQWTIQAEVMNIDVRLMVTGFLTALVILWMIRRLQVG